MSRFFYGLVLCCVMFVVGCSHKDVADVVTGDDVEVVSYSGDKQTICSLEQSKQTTIELPSVSIDVNKQRTNGDGGFFVHDNKWQGTYGQSITTTMPNNGWLSHRYGLFGFMGIHAVDVGIGYRSGDIIVDLHDVLMHFPVDAVTFVIYEGTYNPSWRERIQVPVVPFPDREDCPQSIVITATGGGEDNPLRCFAEDKNYIYAWREYDSSGSGNYELVRVKK